MSICYLCGYELVKTEETDEDVREKLNEKLKSEQKTLTHEEHILHNALCGQLSSEDILCEDCGSDLNDKIDKKFTKDFEFIKNLLNTRVDRAANRKGVNAKVYFKKLNASIDVIWSSKEIRPFRPIHLIDKNEEVLYYWGPLAAFDSYINRHSKEIPDNYLVKKQEKVNLTEDDQIFPHFNIENENFKQGLAKIAIGFASKSGIAREKLTNVLNLDKKEIISNPIVIPFYPLNKLDMEIELRKNKWRDYPHHFLSLFTIGNGEVKKLCCYVELFSTFQFYVILSNSYVGESIYNCYSQSILYKEHVDIELNYKEGSYYHSLLKYNGYNLTWEDFNKKDYKEKTRIVNNVREKTRYNFEYDEYLNDILTPITNSHLSSRSTDPSLAFQILYLYGSRDSEQVDLRKYRVFLEENRYYVNELNEKLIIDNEKFHSELKVYNHKKFFDLLSFI